MEGIMYLKGPENFDTDVSDAVKGDKDAFARLIHNNKVSMYRIAKNILKNEYDIEDAIGNSLLKAYENISRLRKNDSFKPWLLRILINECYLLIKKSRRESVSLELDTACEDRYRNFELIEAVKSLEEGQRIVTILFYYEDMSIKEIAKTLCVPEGTVKSRLGRAKERLKNLIVY
jgi:RNA polymerase sigma-70 factor (ECF subfamily)